MSIIAYPLEATEYTAEDVQSYLSTRTSGVYSEDITFTPEGMTVTVSPFLAWFNYAKFKGCSVAVTEPETLTFSPAHAILDRIDRIALRVDFTLNEAYFTIVEGVASSSPVPPDISKTEVINDISPVYVKIKAGATEITPADITSTILDESVCGIMRDGVTGIPTSQLQSQAEALILRLHEAISEVQTGSAFMIGEVYDPEQKGKPVAFDDEVLHTVGGNVTGAIKNINATSFAAIQKDRAIGDEMYSASFGAGLAQEAASASLEVARITNGVYEIIGRLDVGQTDLKYRSKDSSTMSVVLTESNRPRGTFTGNGNSTRTISVGGKGKMLVLFVNEAAFDGVLFVTEYGAISTDLLYHEKITFKNGVLTLKNTEDKWNTYSIVYNYISL